MDEHEHRNDDGKKIDIEGDLGISRRDMMKRAAIVGGTLVWVAPAIQSLGARAAMAARQGPSPGTCAACYCFSGPIATPTKDLGTLNGVAPFLGLFSSDDCENWCKHQSPYGAQGGAPNGPYDDHRYCSGTTNCGANTSTQPGANGAFCT
jgi:hypothetical protein